MPAILDVTRHALPASWYYDPDHYHLELRAVWYRDWVCVGRSDSLQRPGDYFTAAIGTQNLIVTRGSGGDIRAWHNTCRHRGSVLCKHSDGHFRNGRIICPYHTWTYSIDGDLLATPDRIESADFDVADYSLFGVPVDTWKGFVFVNLSRAPEQSLEAFLGEEQRNLAHWPIESMHSVCHEEYSVRCNWKTFWENYEECYHCPRLHPELCRIMPVYKQAVFDDKDVPGWQPQHEHDEGHGRIAPNAETWTLDGQRRLPLLEGLTEEERQAGVAFTSVTGSMFVVGHPDYVRSVRIVPNGPEQIRLIVDWLLPKDYGDVDEEIIEHMTGLAREVIRQDSEACELNQAGLRCQEFEHGVLMPQEYVLWDFHEWLRGKLDAYDRSTGF